MKFLLLLSLFQLFPLFSWGQDEVCQINGQVSPQFANEEMWIQTSQSLSIYAAKKDLKGFCEWNRMDRVTGAAQQSVAQGLKMEEYRTAKAQGDRDSAAGKMKKALIGDSDFSRANDPWHASLSGHPELKNLAKTKFQKICEGKAVECAGKLANALEGKSYQKNYDVPKYVSMGALTAGNQELTAACGYLSPLSTLGCVGAAKEVLKVSEIHEKPNGRDRVTGVPFIKETLSDEKITNALQRTAAKVWRKIEKKSFGPSDNIFSDLTTELRSDGFSDVDARKAAVKILGAIASGGPRFSSRVDSGEVRTFPDRCNSPRKCNLNAIMMVAIAEGLAHADTLKMQSNAPSVYSLPQGAGFPCDSGKAYHFWMAAALSSHLVEQDYSASASKAAAYIGNLGYHLKSDNGGRGSNLLKTPRYGSVENGLRIDLNMAAAGASFGANLKDITGSEDLKMKDGLIQSMESGNLSPSQEDNAGFEMTPGNVYEWLNRTAAKPTFSFYP